MVGENCPSLPLPPFCALSSSINIFSCPSLGFGVYIAHRSSSKTLIRARKQTSQAIPIKQPKSQRYAYPPSAHSPFLPLRRFLFTSSFHLAPSLTLFLQPSRPETPFDPAVVDQRSSFHRLSTQLPCFAQLDRTVSPPDHLAALRGSSSFRTPGSCQELSRQKNQHTAVSTRAQATDTNHIHAHGQINIFTMGRAGYDAPKPVGPAPTGGFGGSGSSGSSSGGSD